MRLTEWDHLDCGCAVWGDVDDDSGLYVESRRCALCTAAPAMLAALRRALEWDRVAASVPSGFWGDFIIDAAAAVALADGQVKPGDTR